MGAPTFVGGRIEMYATASGNTGKTVSLTGLTGGVASQPEEGDIVFVANGFTYTTPPAGFGLIAGQGYTQLASLTQADSRNTALAVNYKVMGSTPDTSVNVYDANSPSLASGCVILVFRDFDPVDIFDAIFTTSQAQNTVQVDPAAITTASDDTEVIIFGGFSTDLVRENTFNISSSYGNEYTDGLLGGNYGFSIGGGTKNIAAPSTENPGVWQNISIPRPDRCGYVAFTIALKGASGGAAPNTTNFFPYA